jgi:hypothetical protein
MDNLREFLAQHDPNAKHFFGRRFATAPPLLLMCRLRNDNNATFYSGGATNILSRRALMYLGRGAAEAPHALFSNKDTFAGELPSWRRWHVSNICFFVHSHCAFPELLLDC